MSIDLDVRAEQFDDLLEGLEGPLRAGRERLITELLAHGYSADDLREANRQDRLAVLLLEEVARESASMSARDVARECDVELDEVLRTCRLLGLSVPDPDTPALEPQSCDALRMLQVARGYGLSQAAIDELLTVLGRHMWQLAADMEIIVGDELGQPGDTEWELAHRYADAGRVLAPTAIPLVAAAFTAHLRERMKEIFVTPAEAEYGALRATTNAAVAFVDVVGFTRLGERVDAGELKSIAARLVSAADEVVELPVRLVKTIGDAVLLMCRETTPLVEALVALRDAARRRPDLPAIHIGVAYGTAHLGGADVYGAPVNLASRLTDLAPAGRLWATRSVVETSTAHVRWSSVGQRSINGCEEPIEVFELNAI